MFDGENSRPSLPPPHEGGDPCSLDEDEQGEWGRDPEDLLELNKGRVGFVGGSREQRRDYQDEDNSLYQPSDPGEEPQPDLPDDSPEQSRKVPCPDCEAPDSTYLLFARALPNNGTAAVKSRTVSSS